MFKNLPSRGLRTLFLCFILFVFGSGKLLAQPNLLSATTVSSTEIDFEFDVTVQFIGGDESVFRSGVSATDLNVLAGSAIATGSGSTTIRITLDAGNPVAADYTVSDLAIAASSIEDTGNTPNGSITGQTISDGIAPSFVEARFATSTTLEIEFDEDIQFASVVEETAFITSLDFTGINKTGASVATATNIVTVTLPAAPWASDYAISDNSFDFDGTQVQDLATVPNTSVAVLSQNIADGQAPGFVEARFATSTTLEIEFDESVQFASGTEQAAFITSLAFTGVDNTGASVAAATNIVTVTLPAAPWASDHVISDNSFGFDGTQIQDAATVPNSSIVVSSQNIADGQAPGFVEARFATSTTLEIEFDENIQFASGTEQSAFITSLNFTGIDKTGASVGTSTNVVTVTLPNAPWSSSYSISDNSLDFDGTQVQDVATVPNISVAVTSQNIADGQSPLFEATYPSTSAITSGGFTLSSDQDENGTAYYVVVPDGALAPSSNEVKAGTGNGGSGQVVAGSIADVGGPASEVIVGLAGGTSYDVYVVAEDALSNLQASVTGPLAITTLAATTLAVGDLAFTMVNSSGDDEFAFVLLEPIVLGTVIHFTDKGWNNSTNDFNTDSEGYLTFTATDNISQYEQIIINPVSANAYMLSDLSANSAGSVVEYGAFSFVGTGDQILAFHGTVTSSSIAGGTATSILAGIHTGQEDQDAGGDEWDVNASTDINQSQLPEAPPTSLVNGTTAISVFPNGASTNANAVYMMGANHVGSKAFLQQEINDATNWSAQGSAYTNASLAAFGGNAAPVISDLDGTDDFTFTEADGATLIDGPTAAVISDADSPADIDGATLIVSISNNRVDAEDELAISTAGNVTLDNPGAGDFSVSATHMGTFAGGTGASDLVITFNTNATLATATEILQNITYFNNNTGDPTENIRTVSFVYNDGIENGNQADVAITISGDNDVPVIANLDASDDFTFTEDDAATIIDSSTPATLTDADNPANINATTLIVSISANRVDAEDELGINDEGTGVGQVNMTASPNITYDDGGGAQVVGSFAGGTGTDDLVVTFNANADLAVAQAVLRNITYFNNNTANPTGSIRTVSFVYHDGVVNSLQADVDITVTPENDLPSISINATADNPFLEGGSAVIIEGAATFSDAELAVANDFDGSTISIFRNGGASAFDVFTYNDDATYILVGGNGGNIERSGTPIALFTDDGSGTLTVDFNTANVATSTDVNTILQNILYSNTNPTPAATVMLDLLPHDGTGAGAVANTTISIYNNDSDIEVSGGFSLSPTLDYINHTGADILNGGANGLKVGELNLRDGGASADTDGQGTTLTDINLKFTNFSRIQEVALYDASFTTELGEVTLTDTGDDGDTDADEAVFTGLTLSAADNGNTAFSVVVSFNNASDIVDNAEQIGFTVISASSDAAGSQFNAADAGGASPTLGTDNTIIINATDIEFTDFAGADDDAVLDETNEVNISLNNTFSVTVVAVDANNNIDVDYSANVAVVSPTPDGTFTATNINGAALVSGAHTWTDLLFTTVRTGVTFTVQEDGNSWTDTPVFTFDVSDALSDITEDLTFNYPTNIDYTAYSGNIDTQADGVQVAQFIVADGGFGLPPDTDTNGTRLDANGCGSGNSSTVCPNTADGFKIQVVSGLGNIDKIALYTIDATEEIGANVEVGEYASTDNSGTGIFTFNLDDDNPNWPNNDDYTVLDGNTARLGVWVTFKQSAGAITDNEEIKIEVLDAFYDTNFSALANSNGAPAADPGNAPDTNPLIAGGNLIEVTGDRLIFSANDPTSATFERGTEDLNFTVQAQDAFGNVDLDETSQVVISSTGGAIFEINGSTATTFDLVAGEASPTVYVLTEEDATTITVADNDGNTGSEGSLTELTTPATSSVASSVNIHDTTAPFIATPSTDVIPNDDTAMDPITNTLTMQFNEEVAGVASKAITVYSTSPSFHSISVQANDTDAVSSDSDGLVTITLPESPKGSRTYTVSVANGAFDDSPNNDPGVNGGVYTYTSDYTGATAWNFTTPVDATPPTVTLKRNAVTKGNIDVATSDVSVSFDIAFSEEITNFDESDILITTSGDLEIGGDNLDQTGNLFAASDVVLTPDGDNINWTVTISSINAPTEFNTLNITLVSAGGRMTDEGGNDLGASAVSSDFIFDHTAPVHTVDNIRTSNNSPAITGVIDDLTATLSVSVDGNNYVVTNPADGTWTLPAATISPVLSEGTFNVIMTATDVAGNSSVDGTSNELIVDLTAPTIVAAFLFDHDNSGDLDEVTIEFNEDILDSSVELTDWSIGGATPDAVVANGAVDVLNTEDAANGVADDNYITFDVSSSNLGTGPVVVTYTTNASVDISDIAGNAAISNASITEIDRADPVLVTAWQYDTDGDGNIDEIVIEMNEEVDETTAASGDFALGNNFKGDGSSASGILLSNVAANALDANESDEYVTLDVSVVGTAEVSVDYTAGGLTDASGNSAVTTSISTDDQAVPVFVSATYYDVETVDGNIDEVLIEMSEPITDIVAAAEGDFVISGTTLAIAGIVDNGDDPVVIDDQYFTFDIAGATGTAALVLDYDPSRSADANIVDKSGNTLEALANASINAIDAANPIVTNVTALTADGSYNLGDFIQIQVVFSESVLVTAGTPALTLETGVTDRDALYSSGAGTSTMVMGYTVQSGDTNTDLDYFDENALTGSIEDASSNVADLTLATPATAGSLGANKDIVIDNAAPTVDAITRNDVTVGDVTSQTTNDDAVSFNVDFADDIDPATISFDDFTVIVTGTVTYDDLEAADLAVFDAPTAVYTVTVTNVAGDGTIKLRVSTDIQDIAGNFIAAPVTSTNAFTIDNTLPEVVFSPYVEDPTNDDPFTLTVNFDQSISGLLHTEFNVTNGVTTGISGVDPGAGPFTLTIDPDDDQTGDVIVSLQAGAVQDLAGNLNALSADFNAGFDDQAPGVTSSFTVEGQDLELISQLDETGTLYWGVYTDAATPSAADVAAGTGALSFGSVAHTLAANDKTTAISLAADNTDYDLFLLSEDDLGNQEASPTKYDVSSGGILITAPSLANICLEGDAVVLDDIVITEAIITDFRSSATGRTLKLELPAGFEFNSSAAGDGVSRLAGGDISAGPTLTYPSSNTVQVNYTVLTQTMGTPDQLTITGLEVMAVGSTEYTGVTITRSGGSGDLYGASEADGRVFGTLTSVAPFDAPVIDPANGDPGTGEPYITETATNSANGNIEGDDIVGYLTTGLTAATSPITIQHSVAFDVTIYSDETLAVPIYSGTGATSYSPTLDGGEPNGDFGITAADIGITHFWVTTTTNAPESCESAATRYSIAVVDKTVSDAATTLSENYDGGVDISYSLPAASYTGQLSGNALTAITYNDGGNQLAKATFVPSTAGTNGGVPHEIDYKFTETSTGIFVTYSIDYTVISSTTVFSSADVVYCENASAVSFNTGGGNPITFVEPSITDNVFYDVKIYEYKDGVQDPVDQSGTLLTKPAIVTTGPGATDLTTNWNFDPSATHADDQDTLIFALEMRDVNTDAVIEVATQAVIMYAVPVISNFDNGDGDNTFDDYFCENEGLFNVTADVTSDIGSVNGTIGQGYSLIYDVNGDGFGGADDLSYNFVGVHNDFKPSDPNRDDDGVLGDEFGSYRITYTTPVLPATATGCSAFVQHDFTVLEQPAMPTLDGTDIADNGALIADVYELEYTAGSDVVEDFVAVTGAYTPEIFNWYNDATLLSALATDVVTLDVTGSGAIPNTSGALTKDIYLTTVHYTDLLANTYSGCTSEPRQIAVEVYDVPAEITVDVSNAATFEYVAGNEYIFEYCVSTAGVQVTDGDKVLVSIDDNLDADESTESYYTIYDNTSPTPVAIYTTQSTSIDPKVDLIGQGGTFAGWNMEGGQSITFYVSQTDHDNSFDGGTELYLGAESSLQKITIEVNVNPDVPNPNEFTGGDADYFLCSGESLDNIVLTNDSDPRFEWFREDGNTGTPDLLTDGASGFTVSGFNGRFAAEGDLPGFSNVNGNTDNTAIVYHYYVRQYTDYNDFTSYTGCESGFTEITITVYPDPPAPQFSVDGSTALEIYVCEGDLGSISFTMENSLAFTDPSVTYNWYPSNDGTTLASTTPRYTGATATGVNLAITTALQSGSPLYFLISQENNSGSCETELASMALLTINIQDIPSAPTIADDDIYYCAAGGVGYPTGIDLPTALGEVGASFSWYTDDDEDLVGETLTHSSAAATEADLGLDIVASVDTEFYVSQTQTDGVSGLALDGVSAFVGCTSPQLKVEVHKLSQPSAPTVVDQSICDQDDIPTFAATGVTPGAYVSWYDNTPTLVYEDNVTFGTLFSPDGTYDDGTNSPLNLDGSIDQFDGTNTMRITQTTNYLVEPLFDGCTSPESTFDLEIRTLPTIPSVVGSAGNGLNDHDYCSTQDAVTTLDIDNPISSIEYKWYSSDALGSGDQILVSDDTSIDPSLRSGYPTVSSTTNQLLEYYIIADTLGCTSDTRGGVGAGIRRVTFDFNPLPQLEIWNAGTVGSPSTPTNLTDQVFCFSSDVNDDQIFYADVDADGSYSSHAWAVSSTGTFYNDDDENMTLDLDGSYSDNSIGRGEVDNGLDEDFDITYTYTDDNNCTNSVTETMTINPLPYITILNDADLVFNAVPNIEGTAVRICESDRNLTDYEAGNDQEIVALTGDFGDNFSGGSGTFSLAASHASVDNPVTSANATTISLTVLGATIVDQIYETFDITFSGADGNGCANSVTQPLEIQALPEVTFNKISGGCENPAVEFDPLTVYEASGGVSGRDLPYELTDLDLTWRYYRTNANGSPNTDNVYPTDLDGDFVADADWIAETNGLYNIDADGDVRDFGIDGIEETFLIDDVNAESQIFSARVIAYSDDAYQCLNRYENLFATQQVDIEISPNPTFRWEDVSLGEPTQFYLRETRLDATKIEKVYMFFDENVDNIDIIDLNREDDIILSTSGIGEDKVFIETIDLVNEANDVFTYTTDPTSSDNLANPFTEAKQYNVTVAFRTSNDCVTTLTKAVNIVPSIDVAGDYGGTYHQTFGPEGDGTEPFSLITSGWFPENLRDDVLSISDSTESLRPYSWTYGDLNNGSANGLISSSLYPQFEGSDGYAWHTAALDESGSTDTYNYLVSEDSWIYSPAFDITGMSRPMVKFTMIHNFNAGNEGAVLQHSTDGGVTWVPLGSYSTNTGIATGLNWFDFDNVQADPGQQTSKFGSLTALGWSGGEDTDKTVGWESARHSLDEIRVYLEDELGLTDEDEILTRLSNVRFRFAIAATNLNDNDNYFGFALDDFTIQERSKNVLIEQFVSASDEDTDGTAVNNPTSELKTSISGLLPDASVTNRDDVILAYHSDFGFTDPFNVQNPAGPSARSIYYNIDEVTSVLDGQFGGISTSSKAGDLTWTQNDFQLSTLKDPGFNITLTPDLSASDTEVKATITFEANQDYAADTEFRAYVVILEDVVTKTVGGITEFDNVMRKMLPSGSGKYVKLTSELAAGEPLMFTDSEGNASDEMTVSWNLSNIADDANLSAIVFIQNSRTKEIYQSVRYDNSNDFVADKISSTVTNVGDKIAAAKDFKMYPNPTDHEVFVLFDRLIQENMEWSVFDQTGRVFDQGELPAGNEGFSLPTDRFPSGVYYMSIHGESTKFEFKKLMVTH